MKLRKPGEPIRYGEYNFHLVDNQVYIFGIKDVGVYVFLSGKTLERNILKACQWIDRNG